MTTEPTLLTIAGSDPSGGAGIQADLKTICSLGVYGAAAITCLTVQNSRGVQNIQPLAPDFVEKQISAVLNDHNVTHIKMGMVGTSVIAEKLGEVLNSFKGRIVYDPVLASTTGKSFLENDSLKVIKSSLLPVISFLTPNKNELATITGQKISSEDEAIFHAEDLMKKYPEMDGVLIKGGHLEIESSRICDYLLLRNGQCVEHNRKRIQNDNLHGTGCTFASAFSSLLCLGHGPEAAFKGAGHYMDEIINKGVGLKFVTGNSNGPLPHHLCNRCS